MAKLSLPKLEFDKKKAGIAGGALLLAVVGWFAWDTFMAEPPPPPPPPPVAAKPPAPKPAAVPDKPAEGEKKGEATADAKPAAKPATDAAPASKPAATKAPEPAPAKVQVVAAPVEAGPHALTARSRLDARECLKNETNQAIHRCAEKFR